MIKPLGNRILIKVIPPEKRSETIIFTDLTDNMNKVWRGEVVEKGQKVVESIKIGDIVHFEGMYGRETTKEDKHRIIDVGALLGIEER